MAIRSGTVLRRRTLFEEAVDIIEREYASDLELDAMARRLATSRRQLQRAFAEAGQTSFRTYLAQVRMGRALELLREGSLPVREVASRRATASSSRSLAYSRSIMSTASSKRVRRLRTVPDLIAML